MGGRKNLHYKWTAEGQRKKKKYKDLKYRCIQYGKRSKNPADKRLLNLKQK